MSFSTRALGAFCVAIAMATFGLPAARAEEPPPSTPCLHVAHSGPCRPWDTVFGHPSTVAAMQRHLDAAQPGFFYGETYLTDDQVQHCADRIRTAAHGGSISFEGELKPGQRQGLKLHGVLGANGAINRAIGDLPSEQKIDAQRVAEIVAAALRTGQPIFFWDIDRNSETMADFYFLSVAEHAALQTQVRRAIARAPEAPVHRPMETITEQQHPTLVPRSATREVRVLRQSIDEHVTTAPTQASDDASSHNYWPWIIFGAVCLGGLGIALFLRHRRTPTVVPLRVEPPFVPDGDIDPATAVNEKTQPHLPPPPATPAPTPRSAPPDPLIGRIFDGKYRVESRIGKGGMAKVYRATQLRIVRTVALKVLDHEVEPGSEEAKRFTQEARLAASLRHPHTIRIFDFGQAAEDDRLYLVMELLEGPSLSAALRKGPLSVTRAIGIAQQLLKSLAEAHARRIYHRDLKPGNIMLTTMHGDADDFVKVIDFGIAKLGVPDDGTPLTKGGVLGTPPYMSPEQAQSHPIDGRSDLYAVGLMLYEMLAGRKPFQENTPMGYYLAHIQQPPPPLQLVPEAGTDHSPLIALVHRALEKDPADRPQTAEEFWSALNDLR